MFIRIRQWCGFVRSEVTLRVVLVAVTVMAFLVIQIGQPGHVIRAPVYALVAATAVSIRLTSPTQKLMDQIAHAFIGLMSAIAAQLAAWNWFQSIEEAQLLWEALALLLMGVFTAAIIKWFTEATAKLQELIEK